MATANEGPMNGHPVRQPGGVVVGRDKNGKSATVDESAVGRKRSFGDNVDNLLLDQNR